MYFSFVCVNFLSNFIIRTKPTVSNQNKSNIEKCISSHPSKGLILLMQLEDELYSNNTNKNLLPNIHDIRHSAHIYYRSVRNEGACLIRLEP